jgi:trk system potassium uptake protein TrkA
MARARYLVIGLGRFGAALARTLAERGVEVVAVDRSMEAVEAIKQHVAYAAELDATDPAALASVDAKDCSGAVVATGELDDTVLTVAALREIGLANIIARAADARQARILRAVGASQVVEVENEMGRRVAEALASGAAISGNGEK